MISNTAAKSWLTNTTAGIPMHSVIGSKTGVYVGCFTKDFESLGGRDPCMQPLSPHVYDVNIVQSVVPFMQQLEMDNPCCQIESPGSLTCAGQVLLSIPHARRVFMPFT